MMWEKLGLAVEYSVRKKIYKTINFHFYNIVITNRQSILKKKHLHIGSKLKNSQESISENLNFECEISFRAFSWNCRWISSNIPEWFGNIFFSIFNDGTTHSLSILRVYSVRHQQPIAISHSSCRIFRKHPEEISFYEMRKKKSEQNTFMHEVIWTCKWERYWRMAGDPVLESCCEWADKNKFLPIDKLNGKKQVLSSIPNKIFT